MLSSHAPHNAILLSAFPPLGNMKGTAAALQKCGGDLVAVLVAVDAVITGTELSALFLFYGFNVTGAAR